MNAMAIGEITEIRAVGREISSEGDTEMVT